MGVISTQSLNLLTKNAKVQIETNKKLVDAKKNEVDALVIKASEQIKTYFESLYAMDLPINTVLKAPFNNNDGEGKFYVYIVYENEKRLAFIEYADTTGKRFSICETHIENGEPVDYSDRDNNSRCWKYGLGSKQDQRYSEMICRTIMQCFDKIQDCFNLKILTYVNEACTTSKDDAVKKSRTIEVLKRNLKEEDEE